jgi:hypothetical protein
MVEDPARLFPLWDHASPSCSPLGLPMCQNRLAVPTWSFAFERVPPARIIELGSYSGALAVALGVHAWWIGAKVISYDRMAPNAKLAPLAAALGVDFRTRDLYTPETEAEIAALIRHPGTTYVLCDGGDKPRELATYAPYLKPGDCIAGHDYCSSAAPLGDASYWPWQELKAEDGAPVAAANDLEPFYQEHMDMAGWLAYRKRGHV